MVIHHTLRSCTHACSDSSQKSNRTMNLNPVSIAFQFLCFTFAVAAGTNDPTHSTGDISINCGSRGTSSALNGRKWLGDVHHNLSSMLQIMGSSTASSVVVRNLKSVDQVPHRTARLSRGRFSYAFQLNPGQKIIRFHFNPSQYKGFKWLTDLLNVEAGAFTLLSNFSASLTADALGVSSFTKEFCLSILEYQQLEISFFPATSQSYAFINGIEVISVPASVSYFHGGDIGVQVVGHKSPVYVDHSTALEIVHRATVKHSSTPSTGDSDDMFPTWAVRQADKINKSTWRIPVDVGFRYLVKIYFSETGIKISGTADVMFEIVINEMIAQTNINIMKERSGDDNPRYSDYLVMMRGQRNEGKRDILISIQSYDETVDGKGILEGFQILKLSNPDNSLASINPLPAQTAESQIIPTLLSILGLRNVFAAVAVVVTSLINVVVYTLREMWEASQIEEKNKPSARADRVCRRFSLAEIELATRNFSEALVIGRGGFGKVYEGLIDNGQEKVAIKRQKFTSCQGSHEFLTEIEMLSELRHVNLVSLIGYCNDHGEMILVYEYMACGTLADHLYKLERGKNTCSSLSWKQRLNICIGAGRGLDYLHTGHGTIHRDIKASNILLDENFVAKVADFGLAKPEDRKNLQSHISTKVKGTPGYFDPFYLSTCRLTTKSDTYAFGVVLLEVLCGRPAVDSNLDEDERILSKWAVNKISQGEVNEVVASSLRDEISAESLKTFVGVAERCLYAEPKNRPTMAQVVLQLELALEQQEGRQLPASNEMPNVSDGIGARNDAIELKMASTDVPNPKPLPEDQTNNRVVNGELPYGTKGGRKTMMHKPRRLWPWDSLWSRVRPSRKTELLRTNELLLSEICEAGIKLAKFDWNTIAYATNHFSRSMKVGEGGLGQVFKAVLPTGLVVAVKRLALYSTGGYNEFKNEIFSLANLQHRNIIKLLGYCIHREERLLVYEFMKNGSLDTYLDDARRECLDWQARVKIITGIARAILYLHRDSVQRVIHRDVKPSNILLDSDMNPKLSDFGIAKSLVDGQSELWTRIAGTLGYLDPECFKHGKLSTKVDVFSFGIVVLQIVSGRRKAISFDQQPATYLADYAWELWKEGRLRVFDLIDRSLVDACPSEEALRCIQVGLLCTEAEPHNRPNMYRVIKMLEGDEPLVEPKEPCGGFGFSSSNSAHTGGTSNLDDTLGTG